MRRGGSILLTVVLSAFAANSYAVNILFNEGFETGALAPWSNSTDFCGGCTWSVSAALPHTGVYSATVDGNRLLEQVFAPTPVALISEASLWLRMPGVGIAAVYFGYSDSSYTENIVNPTADWTKFDVTALLDAGKSLVSFGVYGCSGCNDPSTTFADDFVVDSSAAPVPEPGTALLMGVGASVLAARRRRRPLVGRAPERSKD
jgi:PEP-CTERM motif